MDAKHHPANDPIIGPPQVKQLLAILDKPLSRQHIMAKLKLCDRKSLTQRYLKPILDAGLIQMTRSAQPNSRLQEYQVTLVGHEWETSLS